MPTLPAWLGGVLGGVGMVPVASVGSRDVLKAKALHNGPAHRAGVDRKEARAAAKGLLDTNREQGGVEALSLIHISEPTRPY